ncbi:MAG: hypothetical protein ACI4PW_09680 [Alphaproteobacteria bacterium]
MAETQGAPENTLADGGQAQEQENTLQNGGPEVEGHFHGTEKEGEMGGAQMQEFKGFESPQGSNASEWLCDLMSTKLQKFFWDNLEPLCEHIGMGVKLAIASRKDRKEARAEKMEKKAMKEAEKAREKAEKEKQKAEKKTQKNDSKEETKNKSEKDKEKGPLDKSDKTLDDARKKMAERAAGKPTKPKKKPTKNKGTKKPLTREEKLEKAKKSEQALFNRIDRKQAKDPSYKGSEQEAKDFARLEKLGAKVKNLSAPEKKAKRTKINLKGAAEKTTANKTTKKKLVKQAEGKGRDKKNKKDKAQSLTQTKNLLKDAARRTKTSRTQSQSRGTRMADIAKAKGRGGHQ